MTISLIVFLVSLTIVVKSAGWFLGLAEKIGMYFRVHPFVLGVLLVGFGTSLPEMTVSVAGVLDGEYGIAIPNVVGSNIANILLILGACTVALGTIRFEKDLIDVDLPLLLSTTILFVVVIADGTLGRADSALLLLSFVGYSLYSVYYSENKGYQKGLLALILALSRSKVPTQSKAVARPRVYVYILLLLTLGLLAFGSKLAVDSLLQIVEVLGIAVPIASFFALAIGTSLPELAVSIQALKQGKGDVLLGNIIGSCMFNLLLIGGLAGMLHPQTVQVSANVWMFVGLLVATLVLTVSGITRRIHMWEGASYILLYIALAMQVL